MRGRRPAGPDYVERLPGSPLAKERLRIILETIAGKRRLGEACRLLKVSPQRFHQLRAEALSAALAGLEPGLPGRPAQPPTPQDEQLRALETQLAAQDLELRTARAREEIALTMPRGAAPPTPEKKNAPSAAAPSGPPAAWDESEHMKRLQQLRDATTAAAPAIVPRGAAWQALLRQREQVLRLHIAELARWADTRGHRQRDLAQLLGIAPRTLRDWCTLTGPDAPAACLGRPVVRSACADRNAVIALLDEVGPRLGVPTLQDCFPHMPRAELADLVRRYRRVWRDRYRQSLQVLHWQRVGAVWAMDYAQAPSPIDGRYPYLLAVRDLASGQTLLWLPLASASADQTIPALEPLLVQHGAPLVLKTDNGSPFLAALTAAFFSLWGVEQLFSPPYMPRYNGAIEAGIGSLKNRTEAQASRQGHPAQWSWDDTAAAQAEANATARPRGADGPTPDEAWSARRPLTTAERALFRQAVAQQREEVRRQGGWSDGVELPSAEARAIDRQAISRALVEHGYLLYSRRRIPLPFPKRKAADIS